MTAARQLLADLLRPGPLVSLQWLLIVGLAILASGVVYALWCLSNPNRDILRDDVPSWPLWADPPTRTIEISWETRLKAQGQAPRKWYTRPPRGRHAHRTTKGNA